MKRVYLTVAISLITSLISVNAQDRRTNQQLRVLKDYNPSSVSFDGSLNRKKLNVYFI
jgi:hypothetical protein